jgi:hypothetical protein
MSGGSIMSAAWGKQGIGFDGFIGVDFDGTLVTENWPYGKPIMPMIEKVREWIAEGREVVIFTAAPRPQITEFCKKWFGRALRQTNIKETGCNAWVDDRHILVERDTGRIISNDSDAIQLLKDEIVSLKKEVRRLTNLLNADRIGPHHDDSDDPFLDGRYTEVVEVLKSLALYSLEDWKTNSDDVSEIETEHPVLDTALQLLDELGVLPDPREAAPKIDSFGDYDYEFANTLDE